MTTPSVTVLLPTRHKGRFAKSVEEHLKAEAVRLAKRCGLNTPTVVVELHEDSQPTLIVGEMRQPLPDGDVPAALSSALYGVLEQQLWEAWLAPALAAGGVLRTNSFWLSHASARGLTFEELMELAAGDANEEQIAWCLADRFPPQLALLISPEISLNNHPDLTDNARKEAASRAAAWSGLPIPVPTKPSQDLMVAGSGAVLALGVRRIPLTADEYLVEELLQLAGSFVDPELVLALCTDENRIQRRLAVRALANDWPVRIAECLVNEHKRRAWPIDFVSKVEQVLGL